MALSVCQSTDISAQVSPAQAPDVLGSLAIPGLKWRLSESNAEAHHGPVLEHVELVAPAPFAFFVIHVERLVANDPRIGDTVLLGKVVAVSGEPLPGEFAATAA